MRKCLKALSGFVLGRIWSTAAFVFFAAAGTAETQDAGPDIMFGVCRPNLGWEADEKAEGILDSIKESGAKCVQLTLRENIEVTLRHARYCNSINLPVVLLIMPLETFMENGAEPRPGNGSLWTVYGLSQIDVRKFEKMFGECVKFLNDEGVEIIGIEVFNEINWADFNGDLPVNEGVGVVLDENNYKDHAFSEKYFTGMGKYSQVLAAMRNAIDSAYPETGLRKPEIILGSSVLVSDMNWLGKIGGSVADLGFHYKVLAGKVPGAGGISGVFDNVDAYAVHVYPADIEYDCALYPEKIEKFVRKNIDPLFRFADRVKPVYITEFSYSSWLFKDWENPQEMRARMTGNFLRSLAQNSLAQINWGGVFHFCYDGDENWCVVSEKDGPRRPMLDLFKERWPKKIPAQAEKN